jgi:hypothetical protein
MRRLRAFLPFPLRLEQKARRNAALASAQMQRHRRAVRAAGIYPDLATSAEPSTSKR